MAIVDIPLTYTREALLETLRSLRETAAEKDAENEAEHHLVEKQYLADFKQLCREAAKWDYETAKDHNFNPWNAVEGGRRYAPSCPRSEVSAIDSLISMIERQQQPRFTLSANGKWRRVYDILTADVPRIESVC